MKEIRLGLLVKLGITRYVIQPGKTNSDRTHMTHALETSAINQLHLFIPTLVSGMCVIYVWHWIRLVPDSGTD